MSMQAKLQQAVTLHQRGQWSAARTLYEQILREQPRHFDALHLLAVLSANTGDTKRALGLVDEALRVNAGNAAAHFNRGTMLQALGEWQAALDAYDRTTALEPSFASAYSNRGVIETTLARHAAALASFQRALELDPKHAEAYFNRGNVHWHIRQLEQALSDYSCALRLKPHYVEALFNRGNVQRERGLWQAALEDFDQAIALKPGYASAHFNRGNVLKELKRFSAAMASYRRAAQLEPDMEFLHGEMLACKLKVCDWADLDAEISALRSVIGRGGRGANPFVVLALIDEPVLQARAATTWCEALPRTAPALAPYRHDKIRIGYFSSDYHQHATTHLIAGLFEAHDRSRFEIRAFSFGPDSRDVMRSRIVAASEFHDVRAQSDQDIVALSRQLKIDIAVDLKGFTQDNRAAIFAGRAAPLQVNYLGYPGTMGAAFMDYLIADRVLIPESSRPHYRESLVYLPHSYQVNDTKRPVAARASSRGAWALPDKGFVFACFNSNYKILPHTFDCWMRILKRVPGSVLWLLQDEAAVDATLRREAVRRDIDPVRLVFAPRVPIDEHLARQPLADLFLDTWPCNAHTTASDALWMGLPVLTLAGEAFASRVGASVLAALDLGELTAASVAQYEDLAVTLASDARRFKALRDKLGANRLNMPLFDCAAYTRNLEAAFEAMQARQLAGLPPEVLYLDESAMRV